MNRRSEYKKIALEAVQKAGTIITDYFHHLPKVETKPDHTPVTKADKEAEEIIVSTISKAFPNHGFIGEEFGTENENAEFTWIIDPIDGTKTFIRGMPFFGSRPRRGETAVGWHQGKSSSNSGRKQTSRRGSRPRTIGIWFDGY